jgi:hypothetical protein
VVSPGVYGGKEGSRGNVHIPAGLKDALGACSHVAPGGQLDRPDGTFASGSHVRAHIGLGPLYWPDMAPAPQPVMMHCGCARIGLPLASSGTAHGHTNLLGGRQGFVTLHDGDVEPWPHISLAHSPEQYAHLPVVLFMILHGHGPLLSGWQGQVSHDTAAALAQLRAQKDPLAQHARESACLGPRAHGTG